MEKLILQEWRRFHATGEADPAIVRQPILDAWERSRRHKVNPYYSTRMSVTPQELENCLKKDAELLAVSRPILQDIFDNVGSEKCTIVLVSRDGIVLDVFSRTRGLEPFIAPGNIVCEDITGASGTSTCLQIGEPVQVYTVEHYAEVFHEHVCIAEPVYGINREVLGCVSVTHHYSCFQSYAVALIRSAAKNISEQLRLRELNAGQRNMIELLDMGVITLNGLSVTGFTNSKALSMLGLSSIPENCALEELLPSFPFIRQLKAKEPFHNQEVTLAALGARRPCSCAISFVPSALNVDGGVLLLREIAAMREYAARTLGAKATYTFNDIIGRSPEIRAAVSQAELASSSDIATLILGESGTGKELFAHSIHNAGSRRDKPFIAVNCGAIPRDLVQAELFGYSEGAFTGAGRGGNPGKFELADGGTIFLDEIGEMTMEAQVSLLRLIQNAEVTRIGDKRTRRVNVRIIAATNRNLAEAVHHKTFREDLFYRLNAFTIQVPPLRGRTEDIEELIAFFLEKLARNNPEYQRRMLSPEVLQALCAHDWPGNVRELENTLEYAVYVSKSDVITLEALPQHYAKRGACPPTGPCASPSRYLDKEKEVIEEALAGTRGDVPKAAALLGISGSTLYQKLSRHGIRAKNYRVLVARQNAEDAEPPARKPRKTTSLEELPRDKIEKLIALLDKL
ncbi:sigma 54-interacting transcriptional regulator [Desulfovibrio sp. OttesenSCG-928-C14]|nr:sigma 54-interacting transcriptional regulator [Desulfovibrio sp. OttesenSCG-928-C14]